MKITESDIVDILRNYQLRLDQFQEETRYVLSSVQFMSDPRNASYFVDIRMGLDYSATETSGSDVRVIKDMSNTVEAIQKERRRQVSDNLQSMQKIYDGYTLINRVYSALTTLTTEEKEVIAQLYMRGNCHKKGMIIIGEKLHLSPSAALRRRKSAMEKILAYCNRFYTDPEEKEEVTEGL